MSTSNSCAFFFPPEETQAFFVQVHLSMVDRYLHPNHVPSCKSFVPLCDQYMWPEKDTGRHLCSNGLSAPIYDAVGHISLVLPLEKYPLENEIHPEVLASEFSNHAPRRFITPYPPRPLPRQLTQPHHLLNNLPERRLNGLYELDPYFTSYPGVDQPLQSLHTKRERYSGAVVFVSPGRHGNPNLNPHFSV